MDRALWLASLLGIGLVGSQVEPQNSVAGVANRFSASDIELKGICRFDEREMVCWNQQGKLDPVLSERVKAYHLVDSGPDLTLKIGRKNRLVVFSRAYDSSRASSVSYFTESSTSLNHFQISNHSQGRVLEWIRLVAEPDAKTASVNAVLTFPAQPVVSLPYKAGEPASARGGKVEILSIKRADQPQYSFYGQPPQGKAWAITLKMSGDIAQEGIQTAYQFLDGGGSVVGVDSAGRPVSAAKFFSEQQTMSMSRQPSRMRYRSPDIWTVSRNPEVVSTTVAPSSDLKLMVMVCPKATIRFPDLPLDPY